MKRTSTIHSVSIGPGLYAQVRRPETILEYYRRLQKTCEHKRDPEGTCYHCGNRIPQEAFGG